MGKAQLLVLLDEAGVGYELLPHDRTEEALLEASTLGVDPADVGKTLVVTTRGGYVRAVLPASERLDLHKVRELLGTPGKRTHLATEEDLERDYAEFEVGAVPPLGGNRRDAVLVDRRLAEREWIVFEAGSHEESIRLAAADLVRLAEARVADICAD